MAEDREHDFGFTFANEDELIVDTSREKLVQLRDMIMPLLNNLKKNPDKEMIKWPNRADVIERQIKKLKSLTNV